MSGISNRRSTKPTQALTMKRFYNAINENIEITDSHQTGSMRAVYEDTVLQLTARCAGLIEVTIQNQNMHVNGDSLIVYLHATARDFLEKGEIWSTILSYTAPTAFNPHVALMKAVTLEIQSIEQESNNFTNILGVLTHAYLANQDIKTSDRQAIMLDHLNRRMSRKPANGQYWGNWLIYPYDSTAGIRSFLELAVLFNLSGYVRSKLGNHRRTPFNVAASSLLHYLLPQNDWSSVVQIPLPEIDMVSTLLELGADPNWKLRGRSTWINVLRYLSDALRRPVRAPVEDHPLIDRYVLAMKALIQFGAELQVRIMVQVPSTVSILELVVKHIHPFYPDDATEIRALLERRLTPAELDEYWGEIETEAVMGLPLGV